MNNKQQTIFRHSGSAGAFTALPNGMLRDHNLTFEARGVLAFILSLPADWDLYPSWLMHESGIGRDRLYRILKELIELRYCERQQQRSADGRAAGFLYIFHANQLLAGKSPSPEKPDPEKQYPENKDYTNRYKNKRKTLQKDSRSPSAPVRSEPSAESPSLFGDQDPGSSGAAPPNTRTQDFEVWYRAYPRREARGQAERAYRAARKKADAETLLAGAKKATERWGATERRFIPQPASWLNGKRWLDEWSAEAEGKTPREVASSARWNELIRQSLAGNRNPELDGVPQ